VVESPKLIVSQNGAQVWTEPHTRRARSAHVCGAIAAELSKETSIPESGISSPVSGAGGDSVSACASRTAASSELSPLASFDGNAAEPGAPVSPQLARATTVIASHDR
jgi:hypothetical protein